MRAKSRSCLVAEYFTWILTQIVANKVFELQLAEEADTLGILSSLGRQIELFR